MTESQHLDLEIAKAIFHEGILFNAAAIIGGNALIVYMLQLGVHYGIPPTIVDYLPGDINAGDRLNKELLDQRAYGTEIYKQINHWLTIRTEAEHNREDYTIKEVEEMLDGIGKFAEEYLLE